MWKFCLLSVTLMSMAYAATTWHVSQTGSDSNNGSEISPFATIEKATQSIQSGDTVLIHGGTYKIQRQLLLKHQGTNDRWYVYKNKPGESVTIDASSSAINSTLHKTAVNSIDEGTFQINDAKFIRIEGIRLLRSPNAGFNVRSSQFIHIVNCQTDSTQSSGIGVWYSKDIIVTGCSVSHANYTQKAHEAISFGSVHNFEISENTVSYCGKEGIDAKQACRNGKIKNNVVHHVARQGIYVDGYPYYPSERRSLYNGEDDSLVNVEVFGNIVYNSAQGLILSSEGGTPVKNVSFHHNLVYDVRCSGIQIAGLFGKNGPRSDVAVVNNTVYNAGYEKQYWWSTGGIFLETHNINNVIIRNNICAQNGYFQIATIGQDLAAKNITIDFNLVIGDTMSCSAEYRRAKYSVINDPIISVRGNKPIISEPKFTNPQQAVFSLLATSPAINAGNPLPVYNDPDGSINDLGAYYYGKETGIIQPFARSNKGIHDQGIRACFMVAGRNKPIFNSTVIDFRGRKLHASNNHASQLALKKNVLR